MAQDNILHTIESLVKVYMEISDKTESDVARESQMGILIDLLDNISDSLKLYRKEFKKAVKKKKIA